MKIDIKKIKELLDSDITGYRIGQETNVKQQTYDRYRFGKSKLDDMPLLTAIELQKYINVEENKMKLTIDEIKVLNKLDQVENNELYYEFVNVKEVNKVLSYYNLFDSDLTLTRRVRVDYTNKLEGLQRIAPKSDNKAMALPYKQIELNNNYIILEEAESTVEGLESMGKSVQSKE